MSGVFHTDEESYDDFMGRYSVRLAPLFAEFAGVGEGQTCSMSAPVPAP